MILAIFTVKRIHCWQGKYYTYGGFGIWLMDFAKRYSKILLFAHIEHNRPLSGYYGLDIDNIDYIELPINKYGEISSLINIPICIYRSIKRIKEADIVQARMPDYTGIIGLMLAKIFRKKRYAIIIDDWYENAKHQKLSKKYGLGILLRLHLYIYDYLERLLCHGELVFAQGISCYNKHKINASKCYNILSTSLTKQDLRQSGKELNKGCVSVLTVGRLTSVKNQETILLAMRILKRYKNMKYKLDIIGTGKMMPYLQKKSVNLGVQDCVSFLGQVPHGNELWKHYDRSDIFVLSSFSEGTPKVLLEAQARRIPVIASNVSGIPSIITHEYNGLLFDPRSAEELAKKIMMLVNDEDLRKKIISNGYEQAKKNCLEYRNEEIFNIVNKELCYE